jgi:hypothetical protein
LAKINLKEAVKRFEAMGTTNSDAMEVLSKRYSSDNFGKFVSSLWGKEFSSFSVQDIVVDKNFNGVKAIKKVSEYEDKKLDVVVALAVELEKNTYIGNQRAYQRGVVSYILSKSREFKKAIVAFYTEGEQVWRLSYIKVAEENEENIIVPIYRWSFLVGENEPCRTIKESAASLVNNFTGEPPTVVQIESIFTKVNAVTDVFYVKFMEHYNTIKSEMVRKHDERYKFGIERVVKGIMGQTIALFFLQKCGFLGVKEGDDWGTGDTYHVTKKIAAYTGNNIYKDVFAPLMSALAGDSVIAGERVPVLNGGLFTVMEKFEDGSDFEIPTNAFIHFVKMLGEFNFTVSESNSYDKDVAIDPEMLGRIYESFISTDDEDGRDTKKVTGAVYTPSDIVTSMCKDSIAYWLTRKVEGLDKSDIDELLDVPELNLELLYSLELGAKVAEKGFAKSLKAIDLCLKDMTILEPSVGSGAFLVGMLLEVTKLRYNIGVMLYFMREINTDEFAEYSTYKLKSRAITHSLYGVDVNAGAIDIAKLRIWLSLIVDMKEPTQLPNLDFKLVVGNSVIDRVADRLLVPSINSIDIERIESAKNEYIAKGHGSNSATRDAVVAEMVAQLCRIEGRGNSASFGVESVEGSIKTLSEIKTKDDLDKLFKRVFSYDLLFSEVMSTGGFDIVIGNPPYVRGTRITDIKEELQRKFEVYHGSADLLVYFYENGYNLLKENGVLAFITSNKWMTAKYGDPLRKFMLEKTELLLLVDFNSNKVFRGIAVDTEITMLRKAAPTADSSLLYCSGEDYVVVE